MENKSTKALLKKVAIACGVNIKKFLIENNRVVCIAYMPVEGRENEYPEYWHETTFDPTRWDQDCSFIEAKLNINTVWHIDKVTCTIVTKEIFIEQQEYFCDHPLGKAQARRMASAACAVEFYKEAKKKSC